MAGFAVQTAAIIWAFAAASVKKAAASFAALALLFVLAACLPGVLP
jgi:hypothetical protein